MVSISKVMLEINSVSVRLNKDTNEWGKNIVCLYWCWWRIYEKLYMIFHSKVLINLTIDFSFCFHR